jgi:hypothetical protein
LVKRPGAFAARNAAAAAPVVRHDDPMVGRGYLPMFDEFDDHAPGALTWLQAWYAAQCDGQWEQSYGVLIDTLDNPGWLLRVDLADTALAGRSLDRREIHRSEHDWLSIQLADNRFEAACGPLNLGEAVHEFRLWAERPQPAT